VFATKRRCNGWIHELESVGFWFFKEGREVFEWITFQGLVITQLDTNLVSAIIGMYFGGSLVKK